jgi:hypothetical protein
MLRRENVIANSSAMRMEGEIMKKRWSLSGAEQRRHDANLKRLMAGGVIPQEEMPSMDLVIEQIAGPTESFVNATPFGGYGIAVWVRVAARKTGIVICDCEIAPTGWKDDNIDLVLPEECSQSYIVPGGTVFSRDDVLNHRITDGCRLDSRRVLQGVVIGQSFASLPDRYTTGVQVDWELTFVDQVGNRYPLRAEVMAIRDTKEIKHERPPDHTGLFGPSIRSQKRPQSPSEKPTPESPAAISPSNAPRTKYLANIS